MHLATSELRECEPQLTSALTSWPKCCDLRLCGLRFCERRIGSALDPLRRSLRLASCEVHAAIGGTGLPAPRSASCERCSASCNRASAHAWPRCCELQSASCGLRLAHSSRIAARGLRLAGLQPDQAALSTPCAHAWHRFCELQSATCTLRTAYNSRIAARRTQVGHREAGRAHPIDTPQDRNPQKRPVLTTPHKHPPVVHTSSVESSRRLHLAETGV